MELKERVALAQDTVITHRRWLHAHPELSGQEKETAAYIAAALRKLGLDPIENVGGYGVVAVIEGRKGGKCVGLRADFDALSIQEETGLPFASENSGISHACGHDIHTAMLLGAAEVLSGMKEEFSGTIKLIFQPSEENAADSGAKKMIADGVLENPHVDTIFAQHVSPSYPTGSIALNPGAMSASSDRFFITISGKSSHGSAPESGVDAVAIGAQVITALQTIVSRSVSPLDSVVLTIGKVTAGTRYNIIAQECTMEGTCRTLNPRVQEQLPARMEAIIKGISESMGGAYKFEYIKGFIPTMNAPEEFALVRDTAQTLLTQNHVIIPEKSAMTGEDFSFFTKEVPGVFYWLGCQKSDTPFYPLHNNRFAPDEAAMQIGMEVMISSALAYLNK